MSMAGWLLPSTGGGWYGGSTGGGGWSTGPSQPASPGTWSFGPAPTTTTTSGGGTFSFAPAPAPSPYTSPYGGALGSPVLPVVGAYGPTTAGPYGEGVFTPIDYPALRFLGEGETLLAPEERARRSVEVRSWIALGLGILALLKK